MKKDLPVLKKEMKMFIRGWLDSILFWPASEVFEFVAQQTKIDGEHGSRFALAKVEVFKGGNLIFTDDVPWPNFIGTSTLLLQVYLLSQQPNYKKAKKWQALMEEFCWSFPEFKPPHCVGWK